MTDLVRGALEMAVDGDVAALIADWPLCQLFRLQPSDHAVVVGAYEGKLMQALLELYPGIQITGFEPQPWAFNKAWRRLLETYGGENGWRLEPYGLGTESRDGVPMGEFETDAASFVNVGPGSRQQGAGDLLEATKALSQSWPIDLMVMNIEGYEFQLIEYLAQQDLLKHIKRLAVQWHLGLAGAGVDADRGRMDDLIALLHFHGHRLVYDERPSWTYTERTDPD